MIDIDSLPISSTEISKPDYYKQPAMIKMGQLLYNKFNGTDIIQISFKEGRRILQTIKDGFEFLDTFLRELHSNFANMTSITGSIPKFSDKNDLYYYYKVVKEYFFYIEREDVHFQ